MSKTLNIAVVEPIEIIAQGISALLYKTGKPLQIQHYHDFQTLKQKYPLNNFHAVVINPCLIYNIIDKWNEFTQKNDKCIFVALVYQYIPQELQNLFQHIYGIDQPIQILVKVLTEHEAPRTKQEKKDTLSKREKEILRLLSLGKSIKEIAESIHLSPHTVLTHRKNISSKTGIKTLAGLTVYAISLGLICLNEMDE